MDINAIISLRLILWKCDTQQGKKFNDGNLGAENSPFVFIIGDGEARNILSS